MTQVTTPGHIPKELHILLQNYVCMIIAALFTIAKIETAQTPSKYEWIMKIYPVSAKMKKKNEICS